MRGRGVYFKTSDYLGHAKFQPSTMSAVKKYVVVMLYCKFPGLFCNLPRLYGKFPRLCGKLLIIYKFPRLYSKFPWLIGKLPRL